MISFLFNQNQFSFFVADHLLVGQLCTNPKSDRNLLSCLKVTKCSTSEIGDAPLYNTCSQSIQVMTTGSLPAPSKCKSGLPWITGMCPGLASEGVLWLGTLLSLPPFSPDLNPLVYFVWSYVENIPIMTSHNTKASLIAAIRRVFAELPPALVKKACS